MPEHICQVTTSERSHSSFHLPIPAPVSWVLLFLSLLLASHLIFYWGESAACPLVFAFVRLIEREFYEFTQISKGAEGYQNQCKACVWQEEEGRGRRSSSFSAGRLAPELLCTFSINVISNMSNAGFDCNCSIYNCHSCLEAAKLEYLLWRQLPTVTWYNVHFAGPPHKNK